MSAVIMAPYVMAHVFWFFLFSPLTAPRVPFWLLMSLATGVLALWGLMAQKRVLAVLFHFKPVHFLWGIISAAALYGFFLLGHELSRIVLPFSSGEISRIYLTREQMPLARIGTLLFFWIGPAEEIFWRGFLQERLMLRFGTQAGYVAAAFLYAAVHVYALNIMLFLAALICGLFWGYMYKRCRLLWPVIISHAIWDLMIFVLLPMK